MKLFRFGAVAAVLAGVACTTSEIKRNPSSTAMENGSVLDWERYAQDFANNAPEDEKTALRLLMADLAKFTKVVTKEFDLYHYGLRVQAQTLSDHPKANDPGGFTLFRAKAGRSIRAGYEGANGTGLYAAIDPIQSFAYAGNDFLLLDIHVPAGTRVFDVWDWSVSQETSDAFRKVGCPYIENYRNALQETDCQRFVKLAMMGMKIAAMSYNFSYAPFSCLPSGKTSAWAFVIVDPTSFKAKDISILTPKSDFSDPRTKKKAAEVFSFFARRDVSLGGREATAVPLWVQAFKGNKVLDQQSSEWKELLAEHVVDCPTVDAHLGPYSEDRRKKEQDEKKTLAQVESLLAANRNFPLATTFCGRSVVRIVSVKELARNRETPREWQNARNQLSGFCDGAPDCTYGAQWLSEFSDLSDSDKPKARIRISWRCVTCDGEKERSAVFAPSKLNAINFGCDEEKR